MDARMRVAACGLVVVALAAAAVPSFADTNTVTTSKVVMPLKPLAVRVKPAPPHGPLAVLVKAGTITQAQANAAEKATQRALDTAEMAGFIKAVDALLAAGTVSQTLADAATAGLHLTGHDVGKGLATWTEAQRMALRGQLDKQVIDRALIARTALSALVTAGTITQRQADAIANALAATRAKSGDGPTGQRS